MDLKQYDAQAPAVNPRVSTVQPVQSQGTRQMADSLEGAYSSMQEAFDTEDLANARVEFERGIADIEAGFIGTTDHMSAVPQHEEQIKALREKTLENLSHKVAGQFGPWAELREIEATVSFRNESIKKARKQKLAAGKPNEDFLANKIVEAPDAGAQQMAAEEAELWWQARKPLYDDDLAWANAKEQWEDNVLLASELRGLEERGGFGWRPNPDLSPEKNRQAQNYALTLQAQAVRQMEKDEKKAAAAHKQWQDANELQVLFDLEQGSGYSTSDLQRDVANGYVSGDGGQRLYKILTGQGGPTNPNAYLDAEDTMSAYERGEMSYDQAQEAIRGAFINGTLNQADYKNFKGALDREKDEFESDAKSIIENIYQPSKMDPMDSYRQKRTDALDKMKQVARNKGGQAAYEYAAGLARKELKNVRPPSGFSGEMSLPNLQQYRQTLVEKKTQLLSKYSAVTYEEISNAADKAQAVRLNRLISETDTAVERLSELQRVANE